jgi:hypothetical protein
MHIEFQWAWQAAGTMCFGVCMEEMEIVESGTSADWRPRDPPLWLIGLGLCAVLLLGLVQSGQVRDPRMVHAPAATPCVPTSAAAQGNTTSYVWTFCP